MKTLKDSGNVFALLLMVTAAAAIVMPLVSRGQGDSRNAPPHRTLRTFYVTQTTHRGNQTLTACSSGYHMASLWEIFDMSNLRYDTQLGMTAEDSGFGPPTQTLGWIRTGVGSGDGPVAGFANCSAWTSAGAGSLGTLVTLPTDWEHTGSGPTHPWSASTIDCDQAFPVWCVQD